MVKWAEKPLQDYMATLEDSAKGAVPVFPLTVEALDEITLKELTEVVASFLEASYEAAFGTREILWATIANEPGAYYDTAKFLFRFTSNGLAQLTRIERVELATALASDAAGSSGFFFKAVPPPPPPPCPPRSPSPTPAEEREREAARLRREAEEQEAEARLKREAEEREAEEREAHLKREREAARLRREAEEREAHLKREAEEREREAARLRREAEEREARLRREAEEREARLRREAERLGRETEEHEAEDRHAEEEANEVPPVPKKNGRKRKADTQLVPEDGVAAGRPSRTRGDTGTCCEVGDCSSRGRETEVRVRGEVSCQRNGRAYNENLSCTGTRVQRQNFKLRGNSRPWTELKQL
ncbi:hypothetical protein DFH07DRAFT_770355 [Mycena maculata]|uniref:Uncharacterized protein n=1 Tax=Mycena maculata TaxID=230809 RepID=A0AAD7NL89_9AGAR|nr:hypothetical protein DFH07DRAFT_770355 [Mycena maculata]